MNVDRWVLTGFLLSLAVTVSTVHADSLGSSPAAARTYCQTTKHATTAEALQECCADTILQDPPAKQNRWVKECVTGVAIPKSPEEIAYAEKQKADLAAEQQRRAAREAAGGKVGRKQAGAPITPPENNATPPNTAQAPTTGTPGTQTPASSAETPAASAANSAQTLNQARTDCQKSATRTALASLASLARRMGAKVPSTDCP